jgi:hypothetical protein
MDPWICDTALQEQLCHLELVQVLLDILEVQVRLDILEVQAIHPCLLDQLILLDFITRRTARWTCDTALQELLLPLLSSIIQVDHLVLLDFTTRKTAH